MTLTKALAMSLNTVAVRLTLELTPQAVVRTAHRLGIASKLEPNASIALGTSEVSPLELVGAYAPFANGGFAVMPHVIDRITDANGKLLYAVRRRATRPRHRRRAMSRMMNAMMAADAHHRHRTQGGAAGLAAPPARPAPRQDFRDAWFVGYTAHLVTGVWLGNDDGSPTKHVTGGSMPVEIWSRFMRAAHQGVPVASLPASSGERLHERPVRRRSTGAVIAAAETDGTAPRPPAPIRTTSNQPAQRGGGMDGWLLDNLFGRR